MNKNFEEVYKAEVQQNIPDLWNRIEDRLPEKKVSAVSTNTGNKMNQSKKKKNTYAWIKWASLAAAAMLVILILPAAAGVGILLGVASKSADSGTSATNDSCAAESVMEEGGMMDEAADMEYSADTDFDIETEYEMNEGLAETEEGAWEESVTQSSPTTNEAPKYEENGQLLAGGMCVTVTGSAEVSGAGYYTVYMEIPEEAYGIFERKETFFDGTLEVRVFCNGEFTPEIGETYNADVYEVTSDVSENAECYLFAELESVN